MPPVTLGVAMDPIANIAPYKDTTLGLMLAASRRGWLLEYMECQDLSLRGEHVVARMRALQVRDDNEAWFSLGPARERALTELDATLMRVDPPFDMRYVFATYLLEAAERQGAVVINRPRALRDCNEKLFIAEFPQCAPAFMVSGQADALKAFCVEHGDVIYKPLDGFGGASVFRARTDDPNLNVILETLTERGRLPIIAQRYLPEVTDGDKRILLIDGEPVDHALARVPSRGETRANLAAGGRGEARPLSERDRWICAELGPTLRERGLLFVGIDVIGEHLTEINVTSPTGLRELDAQCGLDIGGALMDAIACRMPQQKR